MSEPPDRRRRQILKAQEGVPLDKAIADAARQHGGTGGAPRAASARGPASTSAAVTGLSVAEREQVIDTFTSLIEGLYTHLPLKRAMYAIDPLQRLRLLRQRAGAIDDVELHRQLSTTVTGLRDAHTRYIGQAGFEGQAAVLPFLVEAFGPTDRARYLVTKVGGDLADHRTFKPGVELRWWNAVPIDRAVDRHADDETGGRPDARRQRAIESLTIRALRYGPPPDERWVIVGYSDRNGVDRELRIDWRVVKPRQARAVRDVADQAQHLHAIDPAAETARRVKKLMFVPDRWWEDQQQPAGSTARAARAGRAPAAPVVGEWIPTSFSDNVGAKLVRTPSGTYGYLRLWSFDLRDDDAFVREVIRLLAVLRDRGRDRGVILDLRANPGGLVWASERLHQLFTPRPVSPTRFSMLATTLTRAMADAPQNRGELDAWRESLHEAVATGELYSRALPLTPEERANDIGQVHSGPVVAVVDANTYSAGDLFAAGYYDNRLGPLVTVGEATGAGGANVWMPEYVQQALLGTEFEQRPLPGGISYTLAVRRATRSGAAEGMAIEDVGVRGDVSYAMTERDLVEDNRDLLAFCGKLLREQLPGTTMRVEAPDGGSDVRVTTTGLDWIDVEVDGRPLGAVEVSGRVTKVAVPDGWSAIVVKGYGDGELKQARRLPEPVTS